MCDVLKRMVADFAYDQAKKESMNGWAEVNKN
jgi:hypothetical protein